MTFENKKTEETLPTSPLGKLVSPVGKFFLYRSNPLIEPGRYKVYGPAGMGAYHLTTPQDILLYLGYEKVEGLIRLTNSNFFHKFLFGELILFTDISIQSPEAWSLFNIKIISNESKT